jgi:hypothetical protein
MSAFNRSGAVATAAVPENNLFSHVKENFMMRNAFFLALVAGVVALATANEAQAWGAYHAGYTHVGYGGVQHYGYTAARTPYGAYSGGHESGYGYGGASYHAGYSSGYRYGGESYGGYHAYTPGYGGGYAVGGYHYGGYPSTAGYGVYRGY